MTMTKEITYNVTLTAKERARIVEQILKKRNKVSACEYAALHSKTFAKAMKGKTITNEQREKLIEFCDRVEGIVSANNTKAA